VNDETFMADLAQQASIYNPQPVASGSNGHSGMPSLAQRGKARRTVLRKGAGHVWEDQTLLEWDPKHFRLFIGNLGNDVNDDDLEACFGNSSALGVKSFVKAKVIRDHNTTKTNGVGFVSYSDAEDYMKAWKAMDGKYVGSRPITIKKATTEVRAVEIGEKKARKLEEEAKKRAKSGVQKSGKGLGSAANYKGLGPSAYIRR